MTHATKVLQTVNERTVSQSLSTCGCGIEVWCQGLLPVTDERKKRGKKRETGERGGRGTQWRKERERGSRGWGGREGG